VIKTKSVFSPIEPSKDGLRILATRFRGRGMPANRYHVWMPNLAPSETLLRAGQAGKEITWGEFSRRYRFALTGEEVSSLKIGKPPLGLPSRASVTTPVVLCSNDRLPNRLVRKSWGLGTSSTWEVPKCQRRHWIGLAFGLVSE